jgi:ATP-dependent 26S proteasome regulatory subunit
MINIKKGPKFVVELAKEVAPADIEEGMRVGVDRTKYQVLYNIFTTIIIILRSHFHCQQELIRP